MKDLPESPALTLSRALTPEVHAETLKIVALEDLSSFLKRLETDAFPPAESLNILEFRDLLARALEPLSNRTRQYELKAYLAHRFLQPHLFGEDASYNDLSHPAYPLHHGGALDFIFEDMKTLIIETAPSLLPLEVLQSTYANRAERLLTAAEVVNFIVAEIGRLYRLPKSG